MGDAILGSHVWENPEWQQMAQQWIREKMRDRGLGPVASISQTHVRAWSTVMQAETARGNYWFKANSASSVHEAALLEAMSQWVGDSVPQLQASDTVSGWFLAENAGTSLADILAGDPDIRHWERALTNYGALQRSLEKHVQDMLALGVPDCRPESLPGLLNELLDDTGACLVGQPGGMGQEAHAELRNFVPQFTEMCAELSESGIAPTLQHDDLHRSNVFLRNGRHVFLDWADAGVAHPFGSLIYPMLQASELLGLPDPGQLDRVRDAYLEPWTDIHDRRKLRELSDLSVTVASVGRALVWRRAVSASERQAVKEYYATGVPRWLKKLLPS